MQRCDSLRELHWTDTPTDSQPESASECDDCAALYHLLLSEADSEERCEDTDKDAEDTEGVADACCDLPGQPDIILLVGDRQNEW
jgi:hypothetical protein